MSGWLAGEWPESGRDREQGLGGPLQRAPSEPAADRPQGLGRGFGEPET